MTTTASRSSVVFLDGPLLDYCVLCGLEVLHAQTQAGLVTLDPLPVLPEGQCSACRGYGMGYVASEAHSGSPWRSYEPGDLYNRTTIQPGCCPACKGTGQRGEPLMRDHMLVTLGGSARPYEGARKAWEAAHRRHRCEARRQLLGLP